MNNDSRNNHGDEEDAPRGPQREPDGFERANAYAKDVDKCPTFDAVIARRDTLSVYGSLMYYGNARINAQDFEELFDQELWPLNITGFLARSEVFRNMCSGHGSTEIQEQAFMETLKTLLVNAGETVIKNRVYEDFGE